MSRDNSTSQTRLAYRTVLNPHNAHVARAIIIIMVYAQESNNTTQYNCISSTMYTLKKKSRKASTKNLQMTMRKMTAFPA